MSDARRGFTLIELVIVLSVMLLLAGIAVAGTAASIRKGRINEAADQIREASGQASLYARTSTPSSTEFYGVKLVGDANPNYVAIVFGAPGLTNEIQVLPLNPNVQVFEDGQPLSGAKEWFYQYGSGFPFDPSTGEPKSVGVDLPLSIRTLDDQIRYALAVYEVGLVNIEEF